jgi:copper transporter 1
MLFTWSTKDLCIIFSRWHITGPFSLLISLIVIVLLTAGYEGVRQATRKYEAAHAQRLNAFSTTTATIGKYFGLF